MISPVAETPSSGAAMTGGSEALAQTLTLIERAPESAAALTLYALVSTLEHRKSGCLFRLTKLDDLDADQRRLAYGLMESLARGEIGTPHWAAAKARMDEAIRGASQRAPT